MARNHFQRLGSSVRVSNNWPSLPQVSDTTLSLPVFADTAVMATDLTLPSVSTTRSSVPARGPFSLGSYGGSFTFSFTAAV